MMGQNPLSEPPAIGGQNGDRTPTTQTGPRLQTLRLAGSFNADLRTIPAQAVVRRERPEREGPEARLTNRPGLAAGALTTSPPIVATAPAPATTANFAGLDFNTWGAGHPPDTNGDVGPTHFVQTINSSVGFYRKSDGVRLAAFTLNQFMSQGHFGNLCDTDNFGDPVVLYDSFEDRWIVTDFAFQLDGGGNVVNPPGMFQCIAASKTGDPVSGGWNYYSFNTTGGLGDYPKFGIWPDGLYMSFNMFGYPAGASFQNTRLYAMNKAQMYAGAASPQVISFDVASSEFTLLPSNARLQTGTPPAGSPNYFTTVDFLNALTVWKFHADWDRVSLSTLTGPFDAATGASFTQLSPSTRAPTPAGTVDTLSLRLMVQNQYSNIGGVESLWNSHTVGATATQSAVRFYQLAVTGGTVAASTTQAANYTPDASLWRFMPSVGIDRRGDMAIGYSASNGTTNPSIRYAGRLVTDAANAITYSETTMTIGTGVQSGTITRWGDYSAMTLDPDGCTFWYTNMYYLTNGSNHQTRIGAFKFPECTTLSTGTLTGTVRSSASGNPALSGALVMLGSRSTTTNASGVYTFSGLPAGTYPTLTVSYAGFTTQTFTGLAVNSGGTTTQDVTETAQNPSGCFVDTSQADFQTGGGTNCDFAATPGGATLTATPSINQQNTTVTNNGFGFTSTSWAGQTFTPSATGTVPRIDVDLFCSGCTGTTPNLTASIRATSAGLPTGADLASATITGFSSGSGGYFTANFASPPTLTSGTQYALVLRATSNPSAGTYAYVCSCTSPDSNPYAAGLRATSSDSGSTWTADATSGGRDLGFKVYLITGFNTPGNFTSSVKDANPASGQSAIWNTITFNASVPGGSTLLVQAAGSNSQYGPFNFVGPDGTASTYFSSGASLTQFNGLRYLQYIAYFTSATGAAAPTLNDVTVCFGTAVPPAITLNPAGTTIRTGSTASMSVAASGAPVPTYQWYMGSSGNTASPVAGATSATFTTPTLSATSSFWARATNAGGTADSAAATVEVVSYTPFTDNTLVAGSTTIKAIHITELRARIDQQRARFGLAAFSWTNPTLAAGSSSISVVHINEMRTALLAIYAALSLTPPTFTDPSLSAGMPIKRVHIQELRDALVVIEAR